MAGTIEEFQISIPGAVINDTYSFALIAFDNSSNAAQISNYALATFVQVIMTQPETDSALIMGLSIGIGVVVLMFVIIICVLLFRKRFLFPQTKKTAVINIQT